MRRFFAVIFLIAAAFAGCAVPRDASAGERERVDVIVTALDSPPQGTVVINNGDAYANASLVNLTISAWDAESSVDKMQFSNDGVHWSSAEQYAANRAWRLAGGIGTRTVYARFSDTPGNWSESATDTIEVVGITNERIHIYLNGQRVAMEENGIKYFFHNDHLGGTNVVTDVAGAQVKYIDYDPFGQTATESGPLSVNKKFTGKELDDSTGLYDYGTRQYDPKITRFITADTADPDIEDPQSLNRYAYCFNNPLRYTDPSGEFPVDTIADAILTVLDSYKAIKNPSKENLISVGIDAASLLIPYVSAVYVKAGMRALSKADDVSDTLRVLDSAKKETRTFSRFMSKAEAEAVEKTGYLRGGRKGETFFTTNKYQTVKSAKSKLALETSPEVRMDFKIKNKPNVSISERVLPKAGESGGGIQFKTLDPVQVKIIRKRGLR